MKGEKKQRNRCETATNKWYNLLGLNAWATVAIRYSTDVDGERVLAECTPDWEYRQCSIKWNLPSAALRTDAELDSAALHELLHFVVAPMADKLKDRDGKLEEFSVESLAIAIGHLADAMGNKASI